MSLQSRYDNCLANILSLCSSTIITALSKKSFDLDKFCLQFVKYFNQMADIEQHFSSKTKRLSNQIVKLKSFLQKQQVSTNSAVSLSMQAQQQYINCSRATLKLKISGYPLNQSSQLKQIEEVEQESSGIKQNYQKQILSRQIQQNNRPATSISIKKHKRKLKTVDLQSLTDPDFRFNTCEQNKQPSQMALTGRTSLYQQLKRLKKQSQSCIKTSRYKWNHKIKRLI